MKLVKGIYKDKHTFEQVVTNSNQSIHKT